MSLVGAVGSMAFATDFDALKELLAQQETRAIARDQDNHNALRGELDTLGAHLQFSLDKQIEEVRSDNRSLISSLEDRRTQKVEATLGGPRKAGEWLAPEDSGDRKRMRADESSYGICASASTGLSVQRSRTRFRRSLRTSERSPPSALVLKEIEFASSTGLEDCASRSSLFEGF